MTDVEHEIAALELRAYALATVSLSRADIGQTDAAILARATLAREVERLMERQQPGERYNLLYDLLVRVASSTTLAVCRALALRQQEAQWEYERARHAGIDLSAGERDE